MRWNPHLAFNGQCEAAFKFYAECLGGKIEGMSTYARPQVKDQTRPEWHHKILHAVLIVGDDILMGSDTPTEEYEEPKGFFVSLMIKDPADADRIFHGLAENGRVEMPIQETFWAARFGTVVDQFGIPWMINCLKTS